MHSPQLPHSLEIVTAKSVEVANPANHHWKYTVCSIRVTKRGACEEKHTLYSG